MILEKSELGHSAAHHLGLIRSLGGLGIFILTSAPVNSHGNHWPQSIWEISQLKSWERKLCPRPGSVKVTQELLAFPLRWGSPSYRVEHCGRKATGLPTCPESLGLPCCCLLNRRWALCPGSCWQPDVTTGAQRAEVTFPVPHSYSVVEPGFEPTSANPKASVAVTERSMWHSLGSHLAHSGLFLCPFITNNNNKKPQSLTFMECQLVRARPLHGDII